MTAIAVFAVLWPLRGAGRARSGSDVEIYRDQLDEIDRDRASGLLGDSEAEAARIEVSRRLLAAAEAQPEAGATSVFARRTTAIAALVLLPVCVGGVYLILGSPQLPDQPIEARLREPPDNRPITALVSQVEAHLARSPEDGRGWEVIAPVYLRLGRYDDAVKARRNSLRLNGGSAEREAELGEALVAASNGLITEDARGAFDRALQHDRDDVRARYYLGLAAEQDGRHAEAAQIWQGLLQKAPASAPWVNSVQQALARVEPKTAANTPGPTREDIKAAEDLTPEQRNDMVRGMVERLAERLKSERGDVEGWMRLVRAYVVLGERDRAKTLLNDARRALEAEPDKLQRFESSLKDLGLGG